MIHHNGQHCLPYIAYAVLWFIAELRAKCIYQDRLLVRFVLCIADTSCSSLHGGLYLNSDQFDRQNKFSSAVGCPETFSLVCYLFGSRNQKRYYYLMNGNRHVENMIRHNRWSIISLVHFLFWYVTQIKLS